MADYQKSRKPKHRVFDVWGNAGRRELVQRINAVLARDYDASDILFIGDPEDIAPLHDAVLKPWGRKYAEKLKPRLQVLNWIGPKTALDGSPIPFSLASKRDAEHLAFMVNTGLKNQGDDKPSIDLRTVVVMDGEETWLDLLLEKAREPLSIYLRDFTVVEPDGVFPRPGYGQEEETAPEEAFTALNTWKIEPFTEIVKDLLVLGGVHVWAGLFESYKSMAALELSAAILQGRPAFDHFQVSPQFVGSEILYLCFDMPHGLFLSYASNFGLPSDARFRANAPDKPAKYVADSPVLREAVRGKVLIVDTMLDLAEIKDAFQSAEWVEFFKKLRALVAECGCLAIVLIAHPTKSGARNTVIEPTEYLKDSVTFGGKIDVGFGFRKVNDSEVHVERIKGRGFERPIKFSLATSGESGRSWISQGKFPVCVAPEEGVPLVDKLSKKKGGAPSKKDEEKLAKMRAMRKEGKGEREMAEEIGVSQTTVNRWIKEDEPPF